jgi:hypothetical protein
MDRFKFMNKFNILDTITSWVIKTIRQLHFFQYDMGVQIGGLLAQRLHNTPVLGSC